MAGKNLKLLMLALAGAMIIAILLSSFSLKKEDPVFTIASVETRIADPAVINPVIDRLADLYVKGFPKLSVDTVMLSLVNDDVSAYDATLSVVKALENSSLPLKTDLQLELLVWLSQSQLSYKEFRGWYEDYVPIEEFGALAINWITHDDPFIRGMAEWAISGRINIRNNEAMKLWPENVDDAPGWYHTWHALLQTEFVLESDYVRQAIRLNLHRDRSAMLDNAQLIIDRAASIEQKIGSLGNANEARIAGAAMEKLNSLNTALVNETEPTEARKIWLAMRKTARNIVLANPDLDFDEIVYANRHTFHSGANITNGGKSFHIKPGGDIYIKKGFDPTGSLKPLIGNKLQPGHTQGMDLWFDADRIVFSYAEQPRYFEEEMYESDQGFDDWLNGLSGPALLYQLNLKNQTISQLTDHPYNTDVEPTYLPDGDVVFSSTRSNFGSQCSGSFLQNKKITNLYKVGGDGENLRSLSNNKDFDRYARVLNDGNIIYTRWEYQERHLWQTHNLWTSRPDGTYQEAIFKQHLNSGPMSLRDAMSIPNSNKLVAIGTGHHDWSQGAVYLLDYQKGTNEDDGFRIVTPYIHIVEGGLGNKKHVEQGGVIDNGGLYQQPFPLSEESFLVCYSYYTQKTHNAKNFGLYYIDVFGNKELIHRDPVLSASYPFALKKREKPPVVATMANLDTPYATVYLADIYDGVPEFEEGSVRYIRIGHQTEWPYSQVGERVVDFNHLHYTPSGSWAMSLGLWSWSPGRVFGVVPVENDGSAHFKVPANIPIYFQALDENYLELRRMRTFNTFQPGEVRGCVGCHESRDQTPSSLPQVASALKRQPSIPSPPSWGETVLPDFEVHIQPILNRNCVSCHGSSEPMAGLDFSDRKIDDYNQSYRTMFGLRPSDPTPVQEKWVRALMHPDHTDIYANKEPLRMMQENRYPGQLISLSDRFSDASVTRVKEFGSSQSKLVHAIRNDYHQTHAPMSQQDWIDLVTWIDLNAPYWGSFVDKEPLRQDLPPQRIFVQFPSMFETQYNTVLIKESDK